MSNGNKGERQTVFISICYQSERGDAEVGRVSFQSTSGEEVLRLIRHNISSNARGRATDGTELIRFREVDAVPDVMRYYYKGTCLEPVTAGGYFTSRSADAERNQVPIGVKNGTRAKRPILLLLESPHVDEVSCDLVGWVPAAGATGGQIHNKPWVLLYALAKLDSGDLQDAPLIICNPLPHPASLRVEPLYEPLRNAVFKTAMGFSRLRDCFIKRLKAYDPLVVINACTGEGGTQQSGSPKALVRGLLDEWLKKQSVRRDVYLRKDNIICDEGSFQGQGVPSRFLIELPHPSGWVYVKPENWFHIKSGSSFSPNPHFGTWMKQNFPNVGHEDDGPPGGGGRPHDK